ncbi:CHAP domain-containing protein [Lacrimispora sp.]|uniref:CHAP domain-containing protein n=1 Tax=Lacrimispora sp. TaxID=2719234 RepID=UPI002FDAB3D9
MNVVKNLIDKAASWIGYLEKKSNKDLDDFTANAGSNNYTCFARDYKIHTGYSLQAQAWCAMFVSEVFVQMFGLEAARKLLGGSLYHYCPTGVNQFKVVGQWHTKPEPGDIIFFTNGTRAYHTGIVIEVTSTRVKTIEGNTSGASGVVENGGGVCQKSYSLSESRIMGYGRPDWSLVQAKNSGWYQEDGGWRFYNGDTGQTVRNDWLQDQDKWYWFDGAGLMVTDKWYEYKGDWYYLGTDGAMVKGLQAVDGKWYYLDQDGKMSTQPVTLTPDQDGALRWPGLAE